MARAVLIGTILALASTVANVAAFDVLAYFFIDESYQQMIDAQNNLTQVSFDLFDIDNKGNVHGSISPPGSLTYAQTQAHLQTFMCVSNYGPNDFSGPRIHRILHSKAAQKRLIKQIVSKALSLSFTGVNIDFESVPHVDRSRLTAFMQALSSSLHANGLKLVMSVPAVTVDDPTDSWAGAYDFTKLGQAVDILQVMTYDENGPWGAPGPVAGLDWVKNCIEFTKTIVDPSKISMGVPGYGYDWNTDADTGVSLNYQQLKNLISTLNVTPKWDATTSSPYFTYVDSNDGSHHTVWYENAQSLTLKGQYARTANIAGVSVWALDGLDSEFWSSLL